MAKRNPPETKKVTISNAVRSPLTTPYKSWKPSFNKRQRQSRHHPNQSRATKPENAATTGHELPPCPAYEPLIKKTLSLSFKDQVKQLPKSTVFTIGNVKLSSEEVEVLEKGLSFVPVMPDTPDENLAEINNFARPINKLIRSMIIDAQNEDPTFHVRAALNPITDMIRAARPKDYSFTTSLVQSLAKHHETAKKQPDQPNLTESQISTIKRLQSNRAVIIKPVDKNLGVAVIEKELYLKLANDQHLNDRSTYSKLDTDPLESTIKKVNNTLEGLHDSFAISTATYKRLKARPYSSNGTFYVLPKLHKGKLESRPICSNANHPTMHISNYLHEVMLPTAKSSRSYLDNSLELVSILKTIKPTTNTYLVTADIKSLYTNIPSNEGPYIVANEVRNSQKEAATLEALLSLVLNNNVFSFNGEFFRQVNGTAMGTIMAPTYANCYLRAKEQQGLKKWLDSNSNVLLFKRYIDDILTVYDNHDNSLPSFIQSLRKAYAPLELTFKLGRTSIVYLDTELTINDATNCIDHELYRKPTSNKTYIPASSNHPAHMLNNIIYNDLLRAHRLCNTISAQRKHQTIIISNALKQGYSRAIVNKQIRRANKRKLEPRKTTDDEEATTAMVTLTYNGDNTQQLASQLRSHWQQHASDQAKLMIAYRCNSNLKKLLVRSKAPFVNTKTTVRTSQPIDEQISASKRTITLDSWLIHQHQPPS